MFSAMIDLDFPVQLEPAAEGGYVVSFPDVPEALTQGDTLPEALRNAVEALETALQFYTDAGSPLPKAGPPRPGQRTVRPGALVCIKLAIHQAMREDGVRKSDLARRLGWHLPQVDRLLDLGHGSRLEQAEAALAALGRALTVQVDRAA